MARRREPIASTISTGSRRIPAFQGEGAGTLLLDEVERRLRQREARMLVVETSSRVGLRGDAPIL